MLQQITDLPTLRDTVAAWRRAGDSIALVPTMGALHRGHLALVETAKNHAKRVIVSIFVNPTQFGPNEDFSRYPRPLEKDIAALASVGTDAAWLPDVATMYPEGFNTSIHIGGVTETLEGAFRPGHFDGVATVVAKLFNQAQPDCAFFGEKDYQQLALIKRLVSDLNIPINIIGVPTLRDVDGLALSSRNQYLSAQERPVAAQLHATLQATATAIVSGEPVPGLLQYAKNHLLKHDFRAVDYIALHDAETFVALSEYRKPARLLAAAWLGTTRLIDNVEVG
jgi:pantoate--beta-alanine ligase